MIRAYRGDMRVRVRAVILDEGRLVVTLGAGPSTLLGSRGRRREEATAALVSGVTEETGLQIWPAPLGPVRPPILPQCSPGSPADAAT